MSVTVQHRRGTTAEFNSVTPAAGEIGMDTARNKFRFGDGVTQGGIRMQRENWVDSGAFTLAASTNDWAPAGFEELGALVVTVAAAVNLTGIAGGVAGRIAEIRIDPSSAGTLTLKAQSTSSAASNRFITPTGKDLVLAAGQTAQLSYDATNSRWLARGSARANIISVATAGFQQETDVQAALDALSGRLAMVVTRTSAAPPGAPVNGQNHILPAAPTGAWAGQAGKIATFSTVAGAWSFTAPVAGQYVVSTEDECLMRYTGAAWVRPTTNFYLGKELTPPQITTNQNDWAPTGLVDATVVRFSTDQDGRAITGLGGGDAGQIKVLLNIGTKSLVLNAENAGSVAANRFTLGYDVTVRPSESVTLRWDTTLQRWTLIARSFVAIKEMPGEIYYTGGISPAIAADQNDWAPAGFATCSTIYAAPSVAAAVSGLAAGSNGREITIFNMNAFNLTIKDQSVLSAAANRFALGSDLVLGQYQSMTFIYNGVINRWLLVATTVGVVSIAAQINAILAGSDGSNNTLKKIDDKILAILSGTDTTNDTLLEVAQMVAALKTGSTGGVNDTLKLVYDYVTAQRAAADANAVAMAIALG